jgi:Ca2+-binding RTX toxin-like protein
MPTITGTAGDDILEGTPESDVINGLGGNDTIVDQFAYGNDTINAGEGNDTVIVSRFGQNTILTPLTIDGGSGDDLLRIGPTYGRNVFLSGGAGRDRIEIFNAAQFAIDAGADDDVIKITAAHGAMSMDASITLGSGADVVLFSYATYAGFGAIDITFSDFATGLSGDRIDFGDLFANVSEPLGGSLTQQGTDAVLTIHNVQFTFQNTSAAALTAFNLGGFTPAGLVSYTINGTNGPDTLAGQLGADVVNGGDGDDIISGGYSADQLNGGAGNDDIDGGPGNDVLRGGLNDDILRDSAGIGTGTMYGDEGDDTFLFTRPVNGPIVSAAMYGGAGADTFLVDVPYQSTVTIDGGAGADTASIGYAGGSVDLGDDDDTLILSPKAGATISIELGSGSDLITFNGGPPELVLANGIHITDFQEGDGGDVIDIFSHIALTWDYVTNPLSDPEYFGGGRLGLVKFDGLDHGQITAFNLSGFATDGSPFAGQTFTGDGGANSITGSRGGDTIDGLGDTDTLRGGWGSDTLNGGDGNDNLDGEGGSDTVDGGAGNDIINDFVQGDDTLNGGSGNDVIHLRRDWTTISRVASVIAIDGGDNDDVITVDYLGDHKPDISGTVAGGAGNDTITIASMGPGASTVSGGEGNDLISIHELGYSPSGPGVRGIINAGNGNDRVELLSTDNEINSQVTLGGGQDVLALTRGAQGTIGAGNIVTDFQPGVGGDVIELLGFGVVHFVQQAGHTLMQDADNITHLTLQNVNAASITHANFRHLFNGTAGDDILQGTSQSDRYLGGAGDDTYYVNLASDVVLESPGEGHDTVYAYASWVLTPGSSVEVLSTASHAAITGINLTGNSLNQTIVGNAGANTLHGGGGIDVLVGLGGNDVYYTDVAATRVEEAPGGGNDIVYASVSYALAAGQAVEILSTNSHASTNPINLAGNALVNTLLGNAGANILNGGGGADVMQGFGGNDVYYVDHAGDRVFEANNFGSGSDTVYASVSYTLATAQQIEGLSAANRAGTAAINLTGNDFANSIGGNAGANVLNGGLGNDFLYGLAGADTFAFTTSVGGGSPGNVDVIGDFSVADDTIALSHTVFASLPVGALNPGAFHTGAAAHDADDRIIYDSATGQLLYDADGIGATAARQFASLGAGLSLTASDFIVF